MWGWLGRLLGFSNTTASKPGRAGSGPQAATTAPPAPSYGVRRPLVGRFGGVTGFELRLPATIERRLGQRIDPAAAVVHHQALLLAAAPLAAAGHAVLVRIPAVLLQREALAAAVPAGAYVWIDNLSALPAAEAEALRARGVRLGVGDGPPAAQPAVDFVVLQAEEGGLDTLQLSAQRWRERWPRLKVVALGLSQLDDIEAMLKGGADLAGGQISQAAPAKMARRPLGTAAHRVCELLNHLALDRPDAVIAEAVRGDAALSYRLLRYANSAAIGLPRPAESTDQAVQMLGRAELYRWLSVQLMSASQARQASRALQECALARGKLLEGLARSRGDADASAMFTLGLLSFAEPLLQVPMAQALQPLRLSENAEQALLRREGPWAPWLDLAEAVDAADAVRVEALSATLGVAEAMVQHAEQAWTWAGVVSKSGQS